MGASARIFPLHSRPMCTFCRSDGLPRAASLSTLCPILGTPFTSTYVSRCGRCPRPAPRKQPHPFRQTTHTDESVETHEQSSPSARRPALPEIARRHQIWCGRRAVFSVSLCIKGTESGGHDAACRREACSGLAPRSRSAGPRLSRVTAFIYVQYTTQDMLETHGSSEIGDPCF